MNSKPALLPVLLAILGAAAAAQRGSSPPPNIVLILVDDLGWTDLGSYGSRYYETPNIDRLASGGMRFTQAYAAAAVCSPTRAALMTGRYPARLGITDWIRARFQGGTMPEDGRNPAGLDRVDDRPLLVARNPLWMEHDEVTIAEALEPNGYVSTHIGKWHLGMDDWYPQHQGFAENFGGCDYGEPPSYFDPFANRQLSGIPHLPPRTPGQYLTDREADEAVAFIRRNRNRPFFLYLAHYAVHTPIQAKPEVAARYAAKTPTNQKNPDYAAMVESVDDAVGRVLGTLDQLGLSSRTLVIFTSDNGGLLGPTDNAPLRSGKGYPYEGGIRVPLIASWPGKIPPGTVSEEAVSSIDVLPTILDAVGRPFPGVGMVDGVSLLRHLFSGGRKRLRRETLYWHFPHYRGTDVAPYSIIRWRNWKLIKRYEGPRCELYQLGRDPSEQHNLADHRPGLVRRLERRLDRWLQRVGATIPVPASPVEESGER